VRLAEPEQQQQPIGATSQARVSYQHQLVGLLSAGQIFINGAQFANLRALRLAISCHF